jgi:Na+/H+ antiporter NhaD/arsenite permease-like protein
MSTHSWRVPLAVGGAILISAHVVALHHVVSRLAIPAGATLFVLGMVVVKHTGVFTVLRGRFRRRS